MSTNHLIIGLGGTGGKIIRELRKTLFQEFRGKRLEKVNLGYLYVDSSQEMMGIDDPTWKILGTSVQLDPGQQVLIREANLVTQLENINSFPGIKSWIGDRALWRTVLSGLDVGKAAGGQKRRLGRFLFACKIQDFNQRLKLRVAELQNTGEAAVTFHLCAGLAGGTGSGSLIDVIAQIRQAYRDRAKHRILLYTLLPEENPKPNWDTGNYHSNGYAALLDLNALSVGRIQPHDVTPGKVALMPPTHLPVAIYSPTRTPMACPLP
jgi:Tubulin like